METLQDLLQLLQIRSNDWDYLIVGDGSGVGWKMGCGWFSTLIRNRPDRRWTFRGGMDPGTVSLAEIMAFMQPVLYLASQTKATRFRRIHIVSDSEYVVRIGNRQQQPKSHLVFWNQLSLLHSLGMETRFHWIPRDTIALNKLADHLAGQCRKVVSGVDVSSGLQKLGCETIDEVNFRDSL